MKLKTSAAFITTMWFLCQGWVSLAAPSLPVTKAPVTPPLSYTGPTNDDPHAIMGQWVQYVSDARQTYRTHEFHDNIAGNGGGTAGSLAISGVVSYIEWGVPDPFSGISPIVAFDVVATVSNDLGSGSGSWAIATNSHGEARAYGATYTGTLFNALITADFAAARLIPNNIGNPPYRNASPYITATNHDVLAWYCYNFQLNQNGDFRVPGWQLGNITPGESRSVTMNFVVETYEQVPDVIMPEDPRYAVIYDSWTNGTDILVNRSTSLKINQWISDPQFDDGTAYPQSEGTDLSNVSVFHNIIASNAMAEPIAIKSLQCSANLATNYLQSVGSSGITWQILQTCSNLTSSNWNNILTNRSYPSPQTNSWTNATVKAPIQFYRIIQP